MTDPMMDAGGESDDTGSQVLKLALLILVPIALAAILVGVPVFLALRDSGGEGADADPVETTELAATTTQPQTQDKMPESSAKTALDGESSTTAKGEPAPSGDLDALFGVVRDLGGSSFGTSDVEGVVAAVAPELPPIGVPEDAELSWLSVDAKKGTGSSEGEFTYTAFVHYSTEKGQGEMIEFYTQEAVSMDLDQGETETGSDNDGEFTKTEFGGFSSHPNPDLNWAHLTVTIRPAEPGSEVVFFYSEERVGGLPTGGLLGDLAGAIPLGVDYSPTEAAVRFSRFDPLLPQVDIALSVNGATMRLVENDIAEANGYAEAYRQTGGWDLDKVDDGRAVLDRIGDPDVRAYASVGYKGDDATHVYNTIYLSTVVPTRADEN